MAEEATILFVCPHGAAKSVLAAALFNQHAVDRGLEMVALATGTEPDPQFLPSVLNVVQELGTDLAGQQPRQVTPEDVQSARQVVSIGADLSALLAPGQTVTNWDDVPALSQDFAAGRAAISAHVRALVEELSTDRAAAP